MRWADAFLPPAHEAVDEAAHHGVMVFQVGNDGPFDHSTFSGHFLTPFILRSKVRRSLQSDLIGQFTVSTMNFEP